MVNNIVILGVTQTTALIFNEEFPELVKVNLDPYNIQYSKRLPLSIKLLLDAPRILKVIRNEKEQLQQIIKEHHIDVVISDNRFGLCSKDVECIYITHQLNIQAGLLSGIINKVHHNYIKEFDRIWIPDFENEKDSLAGKLSRNKLFKNVSYIGALSRLPLVNERENKYDYLCLLSGPEPLRTLLEEQLIHKANVSGKKICFVRGTKQKVSVTVNSNIDFYDTPSAAILSELIASSTTVICRSGYSTLMDLHHLQQQNCVLVPTPGQDEQVYLANYWKDKFGARVLSQKALNNFQFD